MPIRQMCQLSLTDGLVSHRGRSSVTLQQLDRLIDWPAIATFLGGLRGSRYGASVYPPLCLLQALLLQQWYGLSDPGLEDASADRRSFRRFVGLALHADVPVHSTLRRFRTLMVAQRLTEPVFGAVTRLEPPQHARRGPGVKKTRPTLKEQTIAIMQKVPLAGEGVAA